MSTSVVESGYGQISAAKLLNKESIEDNIMRLLCEGGVNA